MFSRQQHLIRILLSREAGSQWPGASPALGEAFSTSAAAEKKGYSINKIKLTSEEREGAKAQLIRILRPMEKPATTAEIWEAAQANPQFKSKRFMKQMLQHLKKVHLAKTQRLDSKHFGYSLTHHVKPEPVLRPSQKPTSTAA